jgi:hypothetical protein
MAIKLRTLTTEEKAAIEKLTRSRTCPSPKPHLVPRCLAWVSCNLARRRYIPFPKLLKLKVNEVLAKDKVVGAIDLTDLINRDDIRVIER